MSVMRAYFQRFLFPGIEEIVHNSFNEIELCYPKVFNMKTMDGAFVETNGWAGTTLFSVLDENGEVPEDDFVPGLPKRYQFIEYAKEIGFSWRMVKDGKVPMWNDRISDMGFSARQTEEVIHADDWNNAFSASAPYTGPDGVALCSASHPFWRGGGLQSNIMSPAATISVPAIRQILIQFRRQFDHTGVRRINVMPVNLIHPPEEEWNVKEILKSSDRPDTANRATNVLQNVLTPVMYPYLTSAKRWFVTCDKARHKVTHWTRESFHTSEREDEKRRINYAQAFFAFGHGFHDYLGIIGANPA